MKKNQPLAIVTGASRGLGRAIALGLAEAGYNLVLIARTQSELETLAQEISAKTTGKTWVLAIDISDEQAVTRGIQSIIAIEGRIDVLVNNAAIVTQDNSKEVSAKNMIEQFNVNLMGAFYCSKAVIETMKAQKSGYIFNIASTSGKFVKSSRISYGTSKYAMVGMSEGFYHDLANYSIKVTALCPRYMLTDLTKNLDMADSDKIQLPDMVKTILYCLSLSSSASIKEIVIDNTSVAAKN